MAMWKVVSDQWPVINAQCCVPFAFFGLRQIFFCARNNDGTPCSSSLYNMPTSKYWNYISTSESAIPLREGDSYSWDFAGIFPMEFDSTNIMIHACMLVGADQWVYSATNAFRFVDREISSGTRMCSTAHLGNENLIQVVIFKNELEGIPFLFDNPTGQRICSIATNEVPSFAMNTNAAILTVTLPVSRKTVRYYPRTGRIEEEPIP